MEDRQYEKDRIAFCERQAKAALCRGEIDEADRWQVLIEMWQGTAARRAEAEGKSGGDERMVFYDWITRKFYVERGQKCRLYKLTFARLERLEALLGEPTMDSNDIMYWPSGWRRNA